MATTIVLPGDVIPKSSLPSGTGKKKTLKLGPGLRHIPPNTVVTTIAGALTIDNKKNAAAVEANTGRYTPYTGDLVIATVSSSAAENFNCLLSPHTPFATLPHLAFEGATKKTRPQLPPASLVYCRVASAGKDLPPELTCVDPSTGKGDGLGLLKGGMLFKISLGMARRMLAAKGGLPLLETMGSKVGFEVTVGRNGLVHVEGGNVRTTLAVGRAIQEVDEKGLGEEGQKKVAASALKNI
ncbi:similar to exosome complex exonuclease Rrp40 [Plenodomus lingam JN3]|uniref:Similar to exosome complex exonuclease Rrp40 n=1 Tax=Leptosphaeria maculans (strain JN3 / isolate v23.1.3 / race Av1-4-5-6-7-8) TaxID=985895 RepID=E4ZUD0_LEPMJ|nr:similar to exosome complex exonuclease Rrp40 [Plenodomus lingam JN3]CBX95009.1 similar to exosome complex exonuclease Rrp40 [Plenodomus lingam JN3]